MRKLKLWIVASASVLLLNLSSCASSTTSSVAEPVYTEKVTLSFMASQDWVQDAELDLARQFDERRLVLASIIKFFLPVSIIIY